MSSYTPTIGLEIHAELKTASKMFCGCKNDPDENSPNVNVCPICMGHPGTLPVLNKEAIKNVLKVGVACGSDIADFTEWDRKNYFYPDIPKGYQISQYKYPLVFGGSLNDIKITRIHLEEDTARSQHGDADRRGQNADPESVSLVDFNRAGVPLMELVTEPVIHSGKEASDFAKELQLLLRYLGVGEANMEKGEMRVEANISVSNDPKKLGTKVEVKNLNSFRTVERAIAYEVERHIALLEAGEKVVQETRGWDEAKQKTFSQRIKEDSHDYRYFPEPDIPKMFISEIEEFSKENLLKELPEFPWIKREKFIKEYGIKKEDAELFVGEIWLGKLFENVVKILTDKKDLIKLASNYLASDIVGLFNASGKKSFDDIKITPDAIAKLVKMISIGELSSRGAKDVLAVIFRKGGDPEEVAKANGFIQKSDSETLGKIALEVINLNPNVVSEYRAGKEASLQFLVGQGMKLSKGSANPTSLKMALLEHLG